ncbi:MAG: hypothetical protein JNJ78_02610 [Anaerolineae bacterium]|nr:hypothetical protein [Anaerolineae bacterium]
MSLLDEILSQQAVVISAGVAVLFIFAAIFVAMLSRVKKSRARQQRRRAAAAARAALIQQEVQAQAPVEAAAPVNAAVAVTKAATPTPTAPVTPAAPAIKPPAAPILAAAAPAAQEKPKEETASPAMNDLLSSVFSDEENSARQALLLKGMEPVDVEDLVMLCKSVIGQLRGEKPSHVVTIKEQQLS